MSYDVMLRSPDPLTHGDKHHCVSEITRVGRGETGTDRLDVEDAVTHVAVAPVVCVLLELPVLQYIATTKTWTVHTLAYSKLTSTTRRQLDMCPENM